MGGPSKLRPVTEAPCISLVCPVFNEEQCLAEFHRRVLAAVTSIDPAVRYEIIYVDDGSSDSSPQILKQLCSRDRNVRMIRLSRNFGHQFAITAGIDHAAGDAVVVIDSDLQDPPEVIGAMVEQWRAGYEVVYGVRSDRDGESALKLLTARLFYRLINRLSDIDLPLDSGDFRLLDRKVVQQLQMLRERNRYVRGLVAWVGFRQCGVSYQRAGRHSGVSKYTPRKMLRLAADALTSFSEKPLRVALQLGVLATTAALALAAWILVGKILNPDSALPGFASLMTAVLMFGGLQLLSIGLLGEYVARIYLETKRRPLYVVGEQVNLVDDIELREQTTMSPAAEVWVERETNGRTRARDGMSGAGY